MAKKKSRSTQVHFYFGPHSDRSIYLPKKYYKEKIKTHIAEFAPEPVGIVKAWIKSLLSGRDLSLHERQKARFLRKVLREGGKIVTPEALTTRKDIRDFEIIVKDTTYLIRRVHELSNPKELIVSARELFELQAEEIFGFRHPRIIKAVKAAVRKREMPVLGVYGTHHTILSKELREAGIESSREVSSDIFRWQGVVRRKLYLGIPVSNTEIKRAAVSRRANLYALVHKKSGLHLTYKQISILDAIDYELLKRLNSKQLDKIIRTRDHREIFQLNGLPSHPTIRQLRDWLEKHSLFWRRLQLGEQKRKRKAKS